ncbi:sensor histidine kinase [Bacteroides sp. UBA939]|uniref:sensor histidine kinase n=1 Tax=Bacteroides sp. UBA939 TaxID=1946092 RepID=UPI0025C17619|nr:HAMP domain-containing sensor histidine kinase [Bacteroides sp. UBA939]
MERRIKIVWILSIVAMLLITAGQAYWLSNQYQYMNDEQIQDIYERILRTVEKYDTIRTPRSAKDTSYSQKGINTTNNMFFYQLNKFIDMEERTTIDKLILGVLEGRNLDNMGTDMAIETLRIERNDSARVDDKEEDLRHGQWSDFMPKDRVLFVDSFKINMSDKFAPNLNIIINQYRLELDVPFTLQQFDSLLAMRLDNHDFATRLVVSNDTVYQWMPELIQKGTLFNPYIEVSYPYNPLRHQSVLVTVKISPHTVLVRMGWQLFGSICLIFLLGLCLLFQIRTILKQHRIDELRKSFVNTMIHELKRPVQALKMCVAFLNDKSLRIDEKAMDEVIHDSMSELDNLSAYLSKLRDMTRADDEHTQLTVRTFDIKETLEKLIRIYHAPEDKDVIIDTQFSAETLVTADPVHISNIISNLIENAVKYSGASVRIVVDCLLHDQQLTIRVSDDGIGIPASEQNRVFDKFYRGSNLPDRSLPGIGLGLSYVKLLVEAHHGNVSLSGQTGKGTTVEINIPQ